MYVRGKCVKFLPFIINEYLGRSKSAGSNKVPTIDKIAKDIISEKVKQCPKKGLHSSGSLNVNYVILNRIDATNWAPKTHSSDITTALAIIIFKMWTKAKLNFREYVFKKTMKHVDSFPMKLPIAFPCLLTGIILSQYPEVMCFRRSSIQKCRALTLNYRLFVGTRVPDIIEFFRSEGDWCRRIMRIKEEIVRREAF